MSLMRINTNVPAIGALRHINQTGLLLSRTIARLSSGLRIMSAADDPAGLIISEQLRGQISGLEAASRNVTEADKLFAIAEGALAEVNNLLVDMRALATHAANGATSDEQRAADQLAFANAKTSIQNIITTTRYAGQEVFQMGAKDYLIGEEAGDILANVEIHDLTTITQWTDAVTGLASQDISTQGGASDALASIDNFQTEVNTERGTIGAYQNYTFQSRERTLAIQVEQLTAAESNIRDANIAEEATNLARYQILQQTGLAALAQANLITENVLQLFE